MKWPFSWEAKGAVPSNRPNFKEGPFQLLQKKPKKGWCSVWPAHAFCLAGWQPSVDTHKGAISCEQSTGPHFHLLCSRPLVSRSSQALQAPVQRASFPLFTILSSTHFAADHYYTTLYHTADRYFATFLIQEWRHFPPIQELHSRTLLRCILRLMFQRMSHYIWVQQNIKTLATTAMWSQNHRLTSIHHLYKTPLFSNIMEL